MHARRKTNFKVVLSLNANSYVSNSIFMMSSYPCGIKGGINVKPNQGDLQFFFNYLIHSWNENNIIIKLIAK